MKHALFAFVLLAGIVASVSCSAGSKQSSSSAKSFLAWSMDQHKALRSYSATGSWSMDTGMSAGAMSQTTRTIAYSAPNKFRVDAAHAGGFVQTSVSDGAKLVDYSTMTDSPGMSYDAPASLADATSMQMAHPMFCGSLLYKFFAGGDKISGLVDESKGTIQEGGEENLPDGGKGRVIKFYSTGMFGNASVLIDEKTGMVRRIVYDSQALLDSMKDMGMSSSGIGGYTTTEQYSDIRINTPLDASLFKPTPPKNVHIEDMAAKAAAASPVALGQPAPDITVTSVDGKAVKLSSLRGKPVFLDFWATWCPPCRASLPHTQKLAATHGNEITVLAISDEDQDTIMSFEKANNYSYPTYRDVDKSAGQAYHVVSIPTFVTIDAKGNVVNYQSGYSSDGPLDAALEKVGIKA